MATTPTWLAATSGQQGVAGQVNQFLGTHASTILYAATQKVAQATAGSTSTSTNGLYLAQSFVTAAGQTTVGYVSLPVTTTATTGASLATTTLSLYANSGGAPTGAALASTTLTAEYAHSASGGTATVSVLYPLPVTGLIAATTYWLVLAAAGNVSNSYTWYRSNQTSGASTSTTGTGSWTAQTYGLKYAIYDQTATGLQTCTWDDAGARWTATTYTTLNQVGTYAEYTAGQTAAGYLQSYRTLTYTSGLLTGVA